MASPRFFLRANVDLKLPDWFDVNKKDPGSLVQLAEWCLDQATILFVKSEVPNDFFILHGITGESTLLYY